MVIDFLLKRSITNHLTFLTINIQRLSTNQSNIGLDNQMKLLNDKKQFKECLDLFDKYKEKHKQQFSSLAITQLLKACVHSGDFERGAAIHNLVSSRLKTDFHILTSLIHFYSRFIH